MDDLPSVRIGHHIEHPEEQLDARFTIEPARRTTRPAARPARTPWRCREPRSRPRQRRTKSDPRVFQGGEDVSFEREARRHLHRPVLQARNLQRHLLLERAVGAAGQPDVRHAAELSIRNSSRGRVAPRTAPGRCSINPVATVDPRRSLKQPVRFDFNAEQQPARSVRTNAGSCPSKASSQACRCSSVNGSASSSNLARWAMSRFVSGMRRRP